jgi:hypothetical protein
MLARKSEREREMKLQKKLVARSTFIYLFDASAVRLAALAHCCMRRQCAEILPRSQELDLQLHQQGQSWTLTLFSVPIIAFRTRETRPFAFLLGVAPSTATATAANVKCSKST